MMLKLRQKGIRSKVSFAQAVGLASFDCIATFVSYVVAAWGTTEWTLTVSHIGTFTAIGALALITVCVYAACGMYSCLWRYASIFECLRIALASIAAALVADVVFAVLLQAQLSLRTYVLAWAILLILSAGVRLSIRALSGSQAWRFLNGRGALQPRTLVIGAGEAGSLAVKRMQSGDPDMPGYPVAVVDDARAKQGMRLHGVKIAGTCEDIPRVAEACAAQQIVLAIPSATREQRQRIFEQCVQTGLKVYTLPPLQDFSKTGRVPLHDVDIADLLSREEVELDVSLASGYVEGRTVLVTGGGGSIGSELVRQLLPAHPARVVLFDIYENTVYELYHELAAKAKAQGTELLCEIGSITHLPALERVFDLYQPQVVFHAAAHKHVPLMEADPREAVENNVFGTLNVVRLADQRNCERFVLISTDKAVNPTNVMGATKRMCEMIVQNYAKRSSCVYAAVRFGNVLGSHGSVIPLFKRQIAAGGPVTLTHRDITRYFMTIPEASRLVITAGALAKGGEIFVLDMGEPVKIYDLAINLIRLSGLEPGRDIEIVETGLRPGEKMYEELRMDGERVEPTADGRINVTVGRAPGVDEVRGNLDMLRDSLGSSNDDIKRALAAAVPTYAAEVGK